MREIVCSGRFSLLSSRANTTCCRLSASIMNGLLTCHRPILHPFSIHPFLVLLESDQIILVKPMFADDAYTLLEMYPRRVLIPHRLMPYPDPVLNLFHKRLPHEDIDKITKIEINVQMQSVFIDENSRVQLSSLSPYMSQPPPPPAAAAAAAAATKTDVLVDPWGWEHLSCCMERQNCVDRKTWRRFVFLSCESHEYAGIRSYMHCVCA